jgi:hypothetical protein
MNCGYISVLLIDEGNNLSLRKVFLYLYHLS